MLISNSNEREFERSGGTIGPTGTGLGPKMNVSNPSRDILSFLKTLATWLEGAIIFFALFGFVNWQFQPGVLPPLVSRFTAIDPLTAATFFLAACALLALGGERSHDHRRANIFAVVIIVVAAFDFIQAFLNIDLLESIFKQTEAEATPIENFNHTSFGTAMCFMLTGSALLMIDQRSARDKFPSQYMALVIGLIGLVAAMTYIYVVRKDGIFQFLNMSGSSAICFILLAIGILFARPATGFMQEFTGVYIGSRTARVLIPLAILLPVVLGLLRLWSHWNGLFSVEEGILLLVMSIIIVFILITAFNTRLLNQHDEDEHRSARKLAEVNEILEKRVFERTSDLVRSERQFRSLIENSSDILSLVDKDMQIIYRSPSAERALGWTMSDRIESRGSVGSTHPDDAEYVNRVIAEILKQPGRSMPITFRTRHKQGHYLWVEGWITNMLYDESVGAIVTNFKDVTSEKIANDRFRLVVEGSPFGKILVKADGEVTLVNSKTESLFGYSRRDLVGKNVSTLIPKEDWRKFVSRAAEHQVKGVSEPVMGLEFMATRKDGSQFPVELGLSPIEAGEGLMFLVSVLDITTRKNTESTLAQRSTELKETSADLQLTVNRFKRAEEIASIGHWFYDIVTEETVWSDETYRLFGFRPEECTPTIELFFSHVHPEDVEMVRKVLADSAKQFTSLSALHRIITNDGIERNLYSVANYEFDNDGNAARLYGVSMDVTALRQTEKKLTEYHQRHELLSKATNEAIWDWDVKTGSVIWNHGIETIFGYKNRSLESSDAWWQERIHPDDVDRIVSQIQKLFETQQNTLTLEYRYECADKSYKYVLDKGYIVYHEGKPVRVIGAMQDITELVEYRRGLEKMVEARTRELNEALEKEKELVAVKSKFVSIASHEFRTPLSTIALAAGFVKRHKSKLTNAEIDRKLENIDKQVNQMTYLLDDILTIGKADAGKLQVKMGEMDVNHFKKLAQEAIQSTAKKHKLIFVNDFQRQLIVTDEKLVRNIIINLITNAVKFSPEADRVMMELQGDDKMLTMVVRDFGVGIPEQDLPNLFNTFSRGSNVSEIEGTGLGLSIVKKAVDMLGGKIDVKSELGAGTEFKISIPI